MRMLWAGVAVMMAFTAAYKGTNGSVFWFAVLAAALLIMCAAFYIEGERDGRIAQSINPQDVEVGWGATRLTISPQMLAAQSEAAPDRAASDAWKEGGV